MTKIKHSYAMLTSTNSSSIKRQFEIFQLRNFELPLFCLIYGIFSEISFRHRPVVTAR